MNKKENNENKNNENKNNENKNNENNEDESQFTFLSPFSLMIILLLFFLIYKIVTLDKKRVKTTFNVESPTFS
jgi:predicted membrane channel-forming protein YqfA (hemolysin III family)